MSTILFPGGTWTPAKEPAIIAVGDGDTSRAVYKTYVSDLCIQNTSAPFPSPSLTGSSYWNDNVNGILFNVDRGSESNVTYDSDGRQMFDNLLIHHLRHGVWLKGPVRDTNWVGNLYELQSVYMSRIRVHNVQRSGFTFGQRGTQGGGGNDSFISMCEVGSFNNAGADYAGFEIHCGSITFSQCKSWYGKRTYALTGTSYRSAAAAGGSGWWLQGTNINLVNCQAQDTGGHGFWIAGERNQLAGCKVDCQAPVEDLLTGTAVENQMACYYLSSNYATTGDDTINFGHVLSNCTVGSEGAINYNAGFLFHDHMVNCAVVGGMTTLADGGAAIVAFKTCDDSYNLASYEIPPLCNIVSLMEYRSQLPADYQEHTVMRREPTSNRTGQTGASEVSQVYWDTTIGQPMWNNGTEWVTWGTDRKVKASDGASAWTLSAEDEGRTMLCTSASLTTVTIPTEASVSLPIGYKVTLFAEGAGGVTLSSTGIAFEGSGSPNVTIAQDEALYLEKTNTNSWLVLGGTS
jgi:hypothetical protein